jgi:DNA-binding NtrC family response regulator
MLRIQLVDDDMNVLQALQRLLHGRGWRIDAFNNVIDALKALDAADYSVIIADYRMPNLDGVAYLEWARQKQPQAVRLMLSAFPESVAIMQAINRAEVFRFITKPWHNESLLVDIKQAIGRSKLKITETKIETTAHQLLADQEFAQLEGIEPGITRVEFDSDGAISLDLRIQSKKFR